MNCPLAVSLSAVGLFAVIVLLPVLVMLLAPFTGGYDLFAGIAALFDERHLLLARNSLGLATGATIFCLAIGVPLAFLLERTNLWGGRLFRTCYLVPFLIPPYIHAIVWSRLSSGLNTIVGVDLHNLGGASLVLGLAYFPLITLLTMSGLRSIDRNLEEAGRLSLGDWSVLRRITLPLAAPHIISGAILVFIFAITDFSVPDILRIRVYPVEIFIQFSAFFEEKTATLLSLPLVGVTFLLVFLQKMFFGRRAYLQIGAGRSSQPRYRLGVFHLPVFCACSLLLGLAVLVPVGMLLAVAGPLATYSRVLSTAGGQIFYSLVLAGAGAFLIVPFAFILAYIINRTRMPGQRLLLEFAVCLPLAVPAATVGIGLIKVWNRPGVDVVYVSSWMIILGYIVRFLPLATLIIISGLKQINPGLAEAASLHTPSWIKMISRIVFPLAVPSVISGFFIVFILSLGEVATTLLVIPPGRETIPLTIYNLMHYGADQLVAALCVTLMGIILGLSGIFVFISSKLPGRLS